jgi:hypothetical protein
MQIEFNGFKRAVKILGDIPNSQKFVSIFIEVFIIRLFFKTKSSPQFYKILIPNRLHYFPLIEAIHSQKYVWDVVRGILVTLIQVRIDESSLEGLLKQSNNFISENS